MVTASYDLQDLKVFIDAAHLSPGTPSCTIAATTPVNHLSGSMYLGFAQAVYAGIVYDVRLFSQALTSSQLDAIWHGGSGCF